MIHLTTPIPRDIMNTTKKGKEVDKMAEKEEHAPMPGHLSAEAREHFRKARSEIKKGMKALFPPEFQEHREEARKEMLLAFRSMIDAAIEEMEGNH